MTGISEDTHSSVSLGYPPRLGVYRNGTLALRENLEQRQIRAQGRNRLHKLPRQNGFTEPAENLRSLQGDRLQLQDFSR